jgi:hypothetical protein
MRVADGYLPKVKFSVSFSPDVFEKLQEVCRARRVHRANFIEQAIVAALAADELSEPASTPSQFMIVVSCPKGVPQNGLPTVSVSRPIPAAPPIQNNTTKVLRARVEQAVQHYVVDLLEIMKQSTGARRR